MMDLSKHGRIWQELIQKDLKPIKLLTSKKFTLIQRQKNSKAKASISPFLMEAYSVDLERISTSAVGRSWQSQIEASQ